MQQPHWPPPLVCGSSTDGRSAPEPGEAAKSKVCPWGHCRASQQQNSSQTQATSPAPPAPSGTGVSRWPSLRVTGDTKLPVRARDLARSDTKLPHAVNENLSFSPCSDKTFLCTCPGGAKEKLDHKYSYRSSNQLTLHWIRDSTELAFTARCKSFFCY